MSSEAAGALPVPHAVLLGEAGGAVPAVSVPDQQRPARGERPVTEVFGPGPCRTRGRAARYRPPVTAPRPSHGRLRRQLPRARGQAAAGGKRDVVLRQALLGPCP